MFYKTIFDSIFVKRKRSRCVCNNSYPLIHLKPLFIFLYCFLLLFTALRRSNGRKKCNHKGLNTVFSAGIDVIFLNLVLRFFSLCIVLRAERGVLGAGVFFFDFSLNAES